MNECQLFWPYLMWDDFSYRIFIFLWNEKHIVISKSMPSMLIFSSAYCIHGQRSLPPPPFVGFLSFGGAGPMPWHWWKKAS